MRTRTLAPSPARPLLWLCLLCGLLLAASIAALAADPPPTATAKASSAAKLTYFGYDFFAGAPADFQVAPDTAVPADYRLDAHDVLRVRYWTPTIAEVAADLTVSEAGTVAVPGVGDVQAAHVTLAEFREALGRRLREEFKNPSYAAELVQARTIVVYVTGAAQRPGRYTVRADANLFNVVYAAGGPSAEGSLRHIALKRQGALLAEVDAYQFLHEGKMNGDVRLEDQDIVFFPMAQARVTVEGQVARPAMYEILAGARVADALALAGGMKAAAYSRLLRLQRVENGQRVERTLDARALLADAKHKDNLLLQDGDTLTVADVADRVWERVSVRGKVDFPGDYSIARTPTVKGLINEAKLSIGAYGERADLLRTLPDGTPVVIAIPVKQLLDGKAADVSLKDQDELVVYDTDEKTIIPLATVEGAVKHAASYRVAEGMRVSDLLFAAGGPLPDAATDVAHLYRRVGPNDYKIIRLSPAGAQKGADTDNLTLQDGDRLVVYSQQDVEFKPDKVTVMGEVQRPGEYRVYEGMTLYDLLLQAGGPTDMAAGTVEVATPSAAPTADKHTDVKVIEIAGAMGGPQRNEPIAAGMLISLPRQGDRLTNPMRVELRGQFRRPGFYALLSEDETLASVIERAGGFADEADPFGLSLTRDKVKMLSTASAAQVKTILNAMDQLLPPLAQEPGTPRNSAEILDMNPSSLSVLGSQNRSEKVLLVSPRRLTDMPTSSRIGFSLEDRDAYLARLGKVHLADADVIEVPRKSQVVQVLGAVQSPGPVFHQAGYATNEFIARAGGLAPDADMKRAVIVKVSGTVQPLERVQTIDPGDVLIVPSKYQVIQPPTQRKLEDTLFNLLGVALVIRGLR